METNQKLSAVLPNEKQSSKTRKLRLLVLAFAIIASFNVMGQNTYRNVYGQKLDQLQSR